MVKYIKFSGNLGFNWLYFVLNVGFFFMSYGIFCNMFGWLENLVIIYILFCDGDFYFDNLFSFVYMWILILVFCFIKDGRGV